MLLTASTLFAKNIVRPLIAPSFSERGVARLARTLVIVLTALCLVLSLATHIALVGLLQLGYGLVGQFFPGIVIGLIWSRTTGRGVGAGMIVGLSTLAFLEFTGRDPFLGLNAGGVSILANLIVTVAFSLAGIGRRVQIDPAEPAA
jgi:SSS family solute:Na+ symporter